jgi:hypothetical protein
VGIEIEETIAFRDWDWKVPLGFDIEGAVPFRDWDSKVSWEAPYLVSKLDWRNVRPQVSVMAARNSEPVPVQPDAVLQACR